MTEIVDVHVQVESRTDGRIATVTVDHQAKLNILNLARAERLRDVFLDLAKDDELRIVVLEGAGDRAFIGGADVEEMVTLEPASARVFISTLHEIMQAIRDLPVPVIAKIEGYCLGAGLEIAASCDLRISTVSSRFGMPEVRVGLPSVIEAAILPGIVGWGRARELIYTGEMWDAYRAQQAGLLERVVPVSAIDETVDMWISSILANGPRAIRAQKCLIAKWEQLSLDDAITVGIDMFEKAFEDSEPRNHMRKFLDRARE